MLTTTLSQAQPIAGTGRAERLDVIVTLRAYYLPERAGAGLFPWGYDYRIYNGSDEAIGVDWRSWLTQIGRGPAQKEEVEGLTIVGHRPIILPGEWSPWFRTGVPLNFDTGWM